jgi:hypothetical protein
MHGKEASIECSEHHPLARDVNGSGAQRRLQAVFADGVGVHPQLLLEMREHGDAGMRPIAYDGCPGTEIVLCGGGQPLLGNALR